ncbi:MAG TPA: hypothetical protein VFO10_24785 [Oligoflexus sp.]|uniref:hypothetical protein n=1 Tax=Oligoflexus sp. TaxID=1971216 RepID=UPI002D7FFE19|nr:hypothetical protein [Oligoflexus sp.]HET9240504.1 hypothetical protein [Oligoflexus sp.]
MTDLNPQDNPQGLLASQAQPSSDIPGNLRPTSSEDMIPQPLDSQGILASRPQSGLDSESPDFDVTTSIGASINESMMMPSETLVGDGPDISASSDTMFAQGSDDELASQTMWQKQAKVMDQKIRQNPYAYIAGALGLGLVVGRSLISGRSHSV